MPVYEYECGDHGAFEVLKPLAEFADPAPCPDCARPAGRIVSAPQLAVLSRSARVAHERNERSQHEPRVSACASGGHAHAPPQRERPALQRYTGKRPWVIEHG